MSKLIPLTQGKFALVDDSDYEWLIQWNWCYNGNYALRGTRKGGKQRKIRMHRVINDTPDGMETDHINGDKLDNRRSNLRTCSRSMNVLNCKSRSDNKTGFRGVYCKKGNTIKRFAAQIRFNGKQRHIGYFPTPEEAHLAYSRELSKALAGIC